MRERERELTFDGVLLGHASSQQPGKRRWSEVDIYLTQAGSYVVAGVGQTLVKRGERFYSDRLRKDVRAGQDEIPRYSAHVSETPVGAIQSLYLYDDDGVRYMTHVARQALGEAVKQDDALRAAFQVEEVA